MAALGISRRHTLRDNQGRRSRGTSRVHGGYAGGPSRVHARAGMASERDAVRCAIAVPCGTSPCQDLEPDAGSQADAPWDVTAACGKAADERFCAPPALPGRCPDRYPFATTFPGRPPPGTARDTGTDPRLSGLRSPLETPPARPVRGRPWKTSGYTDRATAPDAVRYASVDTATRRSTVQQGDTRRDKGETPR
jgi:hypothetical protein